MSWWSAPDLADTEATRKARLLLPILRAMAAVCVGAFTLSLFDEHNDAVVSFAFYLPALLTVLGLAAVVRRGHILSAAWALSLFVWVLIAGVLPFFGGLHGQNGAIFAVSVVLIGTLVGGRPALGLALASIAWCGVIAVLELRGALPEALGPYSPLNAWIALSATLLLTTVLMQGTLTSLRELIDRAAASAKERDEVLRRSISAQKMELVGNLSSGIAHDFNNLLTVIGGAAMHLRTSVTDDPIANEVLDDLDAATLRATLMTRQLLSLGQTKESGSGPTDLGLVVSALGSMLPRLLGSRIAIVVEAAEGTVVAASRAGLEQILLNLAVNARDAMPEGGTITIRVRRDTTAGVGVLTVTDTGVGMDAATRARALDAFFTTKASGTGLGLATVQTVVARARGTLEIQSAVGQGSTFEVRIPLDAGAARASLVATRPPPPAASAPGRALVVEDDVLSRKATQRILETAGLEVIAVSNGLEALGLLERTNDFEVVVSDISMPRLEGDELARRLAVVHPTLPVVLHSGNRVPGEDVLASPRRAFVAKPATSEGLLSAVARVRADEGGR